MRFAGVTLRALAMVLDVAFFCLVFFPITRLVKGVWLMSPADHRWRNGWFIFDPVCLVFLIIIIAYYIRLEAAEIALDHALGRLPEPELAREFC